MKKNRNIIVIALIVLVAIILFAFFISLKLENDVNHFIDKEFNGVITNIKYVEGNRGNPSIELNNDWVYIGLYGSKVNQYIQIGDSIIKESETKEIKVYRLNSKGEWTERIFK